MLAAAYISPRRRIVTSQVPLHCASYGGAEYWTRQAELAMFDRKPTRPFPPYSPDRGRGGPVDPAYVGVSLPNFALHVSISKDSTCYTIVVRITG